MIITLLFSIAGGMLAVLGSARVSDIAWKFIRLVGLLTLAMGSLTTALVYRNLPANTVDSRWLVMGSGTVLCTGAVILVIIAPLMGRFATAVRATSLVAGFGGIAGGILAILMDTGSGQPWALVWLLVIGQILSAWLLGSITLAWLLGHAYLTATKMTIAPLRFFSNMLTVSAAARVLFFIAMLVVARLLPLGNATTIWTQLGQWWIIVLLRVGVGLVAVALFAYMVRDCVRLRSTQSATGILYFASVMAYVGELASQYLTRELGWPL